jgi:DeoR/GlpR family transcriptional regulator of sugar metabolism
VAPVTAVHKLITDMRTPEEELEKFRQAGVEVVVVGGQVANQESDLQASG